MQRCTCSIKILHCDDHFSLILKTSMDITKRKKNQSYDQPLLLLCGVLSSFLQISANFMMVACREMLLGPLGKIKRLSSLSISFVGWPFLTLWKFVPAALMMCETHLQHNKMCNVPFKGFSIM